MRLQKNLPQLVLWKTPRRMNMMNIISAWRLFVRIKEGLHRVRFSKVTFCWILN